MLWPRSFVLIRNLAFKSKYYHSSPSTLHGTQLHDWLSTDLTNCIIVNVVIVMFKCVCVLRLWLQGSWPQSVQPICYQNYVQVCLCHVPVFTGQLATKFTAHVCVLCLCLQGSWPQSLQLMFVSCACVYRAVGHKGYSPCYYNYVQVCFLCPAPMFTQQLATKCAAHMLP